MATDRERLLAFLNALDASETTLQRDPAIRDQDNDGDWAIRRWGHIYPDGAGYLLYVTTEEVDKAIREALGIRKRRKVTDEARAQGC
jgi:hypothetical protein